MSLPSIAAGGAAKTMLAVTVSVHPVAVAHGSHFVTARPGDTLSSLSQHEFGRAGDWPALWWANRKSVPDPGMLRVGQRLRVPVQHQVSPWLMRAALAASPAPAPAAAPATSVASAPAQTYTAAPGSFQSCVIQAESGGNAGAVNPYTGAGGLYGFLPSTWQALGFSGLPENASVAEQNAAFAKEYAQSGSSAWSAYDGC